MDEIRRLEWQVADKEGIAKASDRFHETMLLEVHSKDTEADHCRAKLEDVAERSQKVRPVLGPPPVLRAMQQSKNSPANLLHAPPRPVSRSWIVSST